MLYMVTFTINIPQMLAYIYTIHGSYGSWNPMIIRTRRRMARERRGAESSVVSMETLYSKTIY